MNKKKYRKNPNRSIINKSKYKELLNYLNQEKQKEIIKDIDNQKSKLEAKKNNNNFKMIFAFSLLLAFLIGFTLAVINYPFIEINGKKEITLEYNSEYVDEGAKAVKSFNSISDKLIVFNNVDTTKTGTYTISYVYPYLGFEIQKKRIVKIVDTTKPQLTLEGSQEVTVCPNLRYEEQGYEAIDEYDGNITNKVNKTEQEDQIIYKVEDSSGNSVETYRKITKKDDISPKIVLTGNKTIYLTKGTTYNEPGYKATDNCDGDITSKVKIKNEINVNKSGSYNIEYQVTDSNGNTTTEKRTVKITEPIVNKPNKNNNSNNNSKGVIYLTFDDGPSNSITPKLLDILKEENVKATFFVISNCNNFDSLVKREYEEGHTIALHSYTHQYNIIYKSVDNYFDDLNKIRNKVYRITGEYSNIIRFPGGSSNTISKKYSKEIMSTLTKEVENKGYHYFDWNISSGDADGAKSSNEIYRNVVNNLNPNGSNVVLMHDFESSYYTLNAIRDIIKYGKNNGYTFSKITMNTNQIHHRVAN